MAGGATRRALIRVLPYLTPYRWPFLWAFGLIFLTTAFELLKPWPLQIVIDHVLGGQPTPAHLAAFDDKASLMLLACGGIVVVQFGLSAITLLYNYLTIKIGQNMVNDLRGRLYAHLQRLSLMFHSRRQVGDLLYRLTADSYAMQALIMNGVLPMLSAAVLLVGMFVIMIRLDLVMTLVALVVCPMLVGIILLLNKHIIDAAVSAKDQESAVYSLVSWSISAIRVVQAFTKEADEHARFMQASQASLSANLKLYSLQTFYSGAVHVVIAGGTAIVVWFGARAVMGEVLTLGQLVVFIAYLAALYQPIDNLTQTYGLLQAARIGVGRVFEILDIEADLKDGTVTFPSEGARGELEWKDVEFRYREDIPVVRGVSLAVKPGERIAVVGPTGSGKSTLLSMLPRFFDPSQGAVSIDGRDVREYTIKSLRSQISLVLQPPLVFPLSIRENIAYGRPGATALEVEQAARLARIHDFIAGLPDGYDTRIGEAGIQLSEGEKQRVTIARAMLRNKPILILDEPTSALDADTESTIMDAIERLTEGRTTLIIAHRLSTVRLCDRIVVLEEGRVVEFGIFSELMARAGGAFAHLYNTQFRPLEDRKSAALPAPGKDGAA
ncbi:MAG: ABC transporter ATP-binding protein [Alphaproteobacteria bacterium]|nr:ABC transporter ATP-binding protein [Alphaproteobacteria bacterium]